MHTPGILGFAVPSRGHLPDTLALMAREASVPRFNGTAAKKQFFTGHALRGQCRRSTENSSPSFSHKMSISIHYKLLPEDLAFFWWWWGVPLKIFLINYLFIFGYVGSLLMPMGFL